MITPDRGTDVHKHHVLGLVFSLTSCFAPTETRPSPACPSPRRPRAALCASTLRGTATTADGTFREQQRRSKPDSEGGSKRSGSGREQREGVGTHISVMLGGAAMRAVAAGV